MQGVTWHTAGAQACLVLLGSEVHTVTTVQGGAPPSVACVLCPCASYACCRINYKQWIAWFGLNLADGDCIHRYIVG